MRSLGACTKEPPSKENSGRPRMRRRTSPTHARWSCWRGPGFAASGVLHFLVGPSPSGWPWAAAEAPISAAPCPNSPASLPGPSCCGAASRPARLWPSGRPATPSSTTATCPPRKKPVRKLKAAAQALVFAGLALTLASFAMGTGSGGDNQQSASDLTVSRDEGARRRGAPGPGGRGNRRHRGDLRRPRYQEVLRKAPDDARLSPGPAPPSPCWA